MDNFVSRMWRNEVNMRKRERARQQAEELRKMQKMFLLKAMSSPGECAMCHVPCVMCHEPDLTVPCAGKMVAEQPDLCGGKVSANKAGQRLHTNTSKLSRIL